MNPVVVTGVAFGASLLGALSGSSTSVITTPAWVALGATFPMAVAADKTAGMFWTFSAARTYLTNSTVDRRLLLTMGVVGLAGAFTGALLATSVNETILRKGAGVVILGALLLGRADGQTGGRAVAPWLPGVMAFPLGVYEGVLGSGNTVMTSVMLQRTRGFDLATALGHYYALAALWCALAAGVYFSRGAFQWTLAVPVTVGSLAGGTLGARIGRTKGSGFIRPLFVIAGIALAARLLLL